MFTIKSSHLSLRYYVRMKHKLPELGFDYRALEPVISGEIMNIHHSKHHAKFVKNLNKIEEKLVKAKEQNDISTMISLEKALKLNAGAHINHSMFWKSLSPDHGKPSGMFCAAIYNDFGSIEVMKSKIVKAVMTNPSYGWAWLGYNKRTKRLEVTTTNDYELLEVTKGLIPIYGIDVFEHAYYLQYKNKKVDYVKAIFDVANWPEMCKRYAETQQ